MEGFCRGCLIRYDDPMELLHYTEKYRRLFVYSTGIQVKRNDTITFQLCKDCFINMKTACKFKKQCRASDKKFKSYLSLKDVGDGIDFCTFLKNNDETVTFALPLVSGRSTPNDQKFREDDNESTCTSIRNFMTDILQGEEVPDTEARIIREVIEEEADLLDDSLDSHWLQDDASIDTDFRLDFSFSPFATPQSVNHDHYYTPKRPSTNDQEQPRKYFTSISPARHYNTVNDFTDIIKNNQSEKELCFFDVNNVKTDDAVDIQVGVCRDNGKNEFKNSKIPLPTTDRGKIIDNLCIPTVNNVSNLPILIKTEKSIENLDLPIIGNDKSINNFSSLNIESEQLINNLDLPSIDSEKSFHNLDLPSLPSIENDVSISNLDIPIIDNINHKVEKVCNIPDDDPNYLTTSKEIESLVISRVNNKKTENNKICAIDKNLEKALEDTNNQEFSLDDLLRTPKSYPDVSAASTPTIKNILFGENLNFNDDTNENKTKLNTKEIGGLFDELLQNDSKEINPKEYLIIKKDDDAAKIDIDEKDTGTKEKNKKKEILSTAGADLFDIEKIICKLCNNKTFLNVRALSVHFNKKHNIRIVKPPDPNNKRLKICNICGKELSDRQALHRHIRRCHSQEEPKKFICDICGMEYSSKTKIAIHIRGHYKIFTKQNRGKFLCKICGASSTTLSNFRMHQMRHTNDYKYKCAQCDKGFYRQSDLTVHMRIHTGEKPFYCQYCDRYFGRKDSLTQHIKKHIDDKPYHCVYCDARFTNSALLNLHFKAAKKCKIQRSLLLKTKVKSYKKPKLNNIEEREPVENEAMLQEEINITKELPYIDTEMSI